MASTQLSSSAATKPELLAVSFAFPPLALPRSVQVARLLKHLKASTVLVCSDGEEGIRQDPTIEPDAENSLRECLRVPFAIKGWRSLANKVAYRLDLPLWSKTPDRYVSWKRPVLRAVSEFASTHAYVPEALATFGYPMSDHLIGLQLKRLYGVPWIAHFSDPWVGNPYSAQAHDRWTQARNLALERRVIGTADGVIFTSQETLEMVMAKYPAGWKARAHVLPQSFEPASFPASPRGSDRIIIRHTGWFYGPRTPKPLIQTLHAILGSAPELLKDVGFELIGDIDPQTLADSGLDRLPAGLVSVKPPVAYSESLALISSADGLLVIDAPAEQSVFLPSKLVDYIGAGRPIFGLTPTGAAASLISQLGGWAADPTDLEAMIEAAKSFLSYLRRHKEDRQSWGEPEVRRSYEASTVAQSFEKILQGLLG